MTAPVAERTRAYDDGRAPAVARATPRADSGHDFGRVRVHADGGEPKIRRVVVVDPDTSAKEVAGHFLKLCPGVFSSAGRQVTADCSAATRAKSKSCGCLCELAHDLKRVFTIHVAAAVGSTEKKTLFDGSNVDVPVSSVRPHTETGTDPDTFVPANAGGDIEYGAFDPAGKPLFIDNTRILAHELCGHARSAPAGTKETPGNRPEHDDAIAIENEIAAEHGGPTRGKFADKRQGESFLNPTSSRAKLVFTLKDGLHFEAP